MMPPSPLLSARMMNTTYLSDTTMISAQKTNDKIPMTLGAVAASGWWPANTSFKVYSGLVPMSPNTTPMAATDKPRTPCFD